MKLTIDTDAKQLLTSDGIYDLYSDAAFDLISQAWLKVGWNQKHIYTFTWFGRPVIQLPEDMVRTQEVIYQLKRT